MNYIAKKDIKNNGVDFIKGNSYKVVDQDRYYIGVKDELNSVCFLTYDEFEDSFVENPISKIALSEEKLTTFFKMAYKEMRRHGFRDLWESWGFTEEEIDEITEHIEDTFDIKI